MEGTRMAFRLARYDRDKAGELMKRLLRSADVEPRRDVPGPEEGAPR